MPFGIEAEFEPSDIAAPMTGTHHAMNADFEQLLNAGTDGNHGSHDPFGFLFLQSGVGTDEVLDQILVEIVPLSEQRHGKNLGGLFGIQSSELSHDRSDSFQSVVFRQTIRGCA